MKTIPLTKGHFALVDDEDYDRLSCQLWQYSEKGYAVRKDASRALIMMHNEIAEFHALPFVGEVDHADRNGINNQKTNFRQATKSQQQANRGIQSNNTSGYKGVSWRKDKKKWQARASYEGQTIRLGYFNSAEEAARAYDKEATRLFGEFAVLNFP